MSAGIVQHAARLLEAQIILERQELNRPLPKRVQVLRRARIEVLESQRAVYLIAEPELERATSDRAISREAGTPAPWAQAVLDMALAMGREASA